MSSIARKLLHRARDFWIGPLDTRPLALMRVTFGLALVFATLGVAPVLRDLVSEDGVLPRSALFSGLVRTSRVSLFDVAGPLWLTWLLYGATVLATLAFAVGFHTRFATVASFVLVSGLHERNLAVFDGADNVVRVLLFFLMFVPAGDHYSIDSLRRPVRSTAPQRAAFATRLLELQFCWIYFGSFLGKWSGHTWRDGTALHYALRLDHSFTRRLGTMIADVRPLVTVGTHFTLLFEGTFLLLVFSPFQRRYTRVLAVVFGTALHVGIALTMRVGDFSYVMIACYPLLLAPEWVARFADSAAKRLGGFSQIASMLGAVPPRASWPAWLTTPLHTVLAFLLLSGFWLSLPASLPARIPPEPQWMQSTAQVLELWQSWDMFAPEPARADFFLRGDGVLRGGKHVDVLHDLDGGPLPPAEPRFLFTRWTKFIANLAFANRERLLPFGSFVCRRWNIGAAAAKRPPLETFDVYREERVTEPLGAPVNRYDEKLLWAHHCF